MYLDQVIAQTLLKRTAREKNPDTQIVHALPSQTPKVMLSSREIEIDRLVAMGEADKQIEEGLYITQLSQREIEPNSLS